jgi:hypothetical protein
MDEAEVLGCCCPGGHAQRLHLLQVQQTLQQRLQRLDAAALAGLAQFRPWIDIDLAALVRGSGARGCRPEQLQSALEHIAAQCKVVSLSAQRRG